MALVLNFAIFLLPYLLGSITSAVIVSRALYQVDIRTLGSKNAGSSNMFRLLGLKAGVLTQLFDIGKGSLAASIPVFMLWWLPETPHILSHLDLELQSIICGILAVIGHLYPVFFGFKGGKGINTLLGMMLVTNPLACLFCTLGWVLILYLSKYIAVASMGGVLVYSVFLILSSLIQGAKPDGLLITGGFIIFLLVVFTHRENIKRLIAGEEPKNHWFEGKLD